MANLFQPSLVRATDENGNPISGAKLHFYQTETTTPATIYSDQAGVVAASNPVTADSTGVFPAIYLDAAVTYRVMLKTADGATVYDIDPVRGYDDGAIQTAAENALAASASAVASAAAASASASTATTQAGLAASAKLGAETAQAAAEAARDATVASAAPTIYATSAAGIAATTDGQYFSVPSADSAEYLILYKNNAGAAQEIKRYPSTAAVSALKDNIGTARLAQFDTVYGRTTYDTATVSASATVFSTIEMCGAEGELTGVDIRVNGAGTGRIVVYQPSDSSWIITHVVDVTFAAGGLTQLVAGGGVLPSGINMPAGSFIGYQFLSGSATIRYDSSIGEYAGVSSTTTTVGTTVTRKYNTAYRGVSLSYTVRSPEALLTRLNQTSSQVEAITQSGGGADYSSITQTATVGSSNAASGTFKYTGAFYTGGEQASVAGTLRYISIGITTAGEAIVRQYRPSGARYKCIASWDCTVSNGTNLLKAGDQLPAGIAVEVGDVFACDRVGYFSQTGGTWSRFSPHSGVGDLLDLIPTTNDYKASLAVGIGDPVTLDSGISTLHQMADRITATSRPLAATNAYALGDSTIAAYQGSANLMTLLTSARTKNTVAEPGHTIAQQRTAFNALAAPRDAAGWAIIQVGLNDLAPAEAASVAIARLQTLVNDVRAALGRWTPVLVGQMIPCRQRLINLYGATDGPVAYQKWLDMNDAIAGTGPTPITNVDGRITAHVPLMNDGNGNLKAEYDTGDGIHPNTAGRQVNADAWVAALNALEVTV